MSFSIPVFLLNFVAVAGLMLVAWLVSLAKKDVSVVDIFWGLGFVLVSWVTFYMTDGFIGRKVLIVLLTNLWGWRLSLYLLWRKWGEGEDRRYAAIREKYGEDFERQSLYVVFGLQAVLLWVISLVIQTGQLSPEPGAMTALDALGFLVWTGGFIFEVVGDWQLAQFKMDPSRREKVMRRGLWAYTRHPNYFGEFLVWWGMFLICLAAPGTAWVIVSPLVISYLLLKVSGVTLLEKTMTEKHPEYEDYIRTTSAFIPWFPEKSER